MSESRQLTPRRTPIHAHGRSYLSATSRGFHQQSPHNYSGTGTGSVHPITQTRSIQSEGNDWIYGTNISGDKVEKDLKSFITQFQLPVNNLSTYESIYMTKLSDLDTEEKTVFCVSATHIKQWQPELYYQFVYFPAQMISIFDNLIQKMFEKRYVYEETDESRKILKQNQMLRLRVAITNLGDIKIMRDIGPESVNKLISFRGIVVRVSDVVPEMRSALFRCINCSSEKRIELEDARVAEPKSCEKCKIQNTMQIVHNLCEFSDKQFIKFQQVPEFVPQGQTPHAITVMAFEQNVDAIKPGDRVEVVGIYRAQAQKITKSKNEVATVYKTYLDMISYQIVDENRLKEGSSQLFIKDSEKEECLSMSNETNIVEKLVRSFAPSIHGHNAIKKGILAQLFGGTKKPGINKGPQQTPCRSDINVCLVGDPSTAKSQLLQQVYKIAPRGIYTSGRGSSAVGLTANVKKDPQTREFVLESGALVLSDQGICCIDEFDKMDKDNKVILLEGMEQQTISIAKAGIVCQLNCRASIIAAANPIHSRYNPNKSVVQNINLPPALLSRFDLIYLMLDQPQESQDKKIATHLLNLFAPTDSEKEKLESHKKNIFSRQQLTRYITYAREYMHPILSPEAGQRIVEGYLEMRKLGSSTKTITATTRQLESIIRLSEAFAKMKLSSIVSIQDVDQAIELMKIAIQQAATDPKTGRIDMDVIVTGKTSASKQKVLEISEVIKQIVISNLSKYKKKSTFESIFTEASSHFRSKERQKEKEKDKDKANSSENITEKQVLEALKILESDGLISVFGNKNRPFFKFAKSTD